MSRWSDKIFVALYHLVSDQHVPHTHHLYKNNTVDEFHSHLDAILSNFNPISLDDLRNYCLSRHDLPEKPALITLDDGMREAFDVAAPILASYGIPATFFVATDFLDNKNLFYRHKASLLIDCITRGLSVVDMNELTVIFRDHWGTDQTLEQVILSVRHRDVHLLDMAGDVIGIDYSSYLRDRKPYITLGECRTLLEMGFSIGAHSIDHPRFDEISPHQQLTQVIDSVSFLQNHFNLQNVPFAFPFSDRGVDSQTISEIHALGIFPTFGTAGLHSRTRDRHIQRLPLDEVGHGLLTYLGDK